jgi:hypothetical protein
LKRCHPVQLRELDFLGVCFLDVISAFLTIAEQQVTNIIAFFTYFFAIRRSGLINSILPFLIQWNVAKTTK